MNNLGTPGGRRTQGRSQKDGRKIQTPRWYHPILDGNNDEWGNKLGNKSKNGLRVAFQNINGFPRYREQKKNDEIREFMNGNRLDIYGMGEINRCWKNIPYVDSLYERTRGWWENLHISTAYNRNERNKFQYQPGGVAMFSIDEEYSRISRSGRDRRT